MLQDKNQMHPDDMRNLVIFFVISLMVYFLYDHFVVQPQAEALKAQRIAVAQMEKIEGPGGTVPAVDAVRPRAEVLSEDARLPIDNGSIKGSIALKGGRLDDIALSQYFTTLEKTDNVVLLSPRGSDFPRYVDHGWVAAEGANTALPGPDTVWSVRGNTKLSKDNPVTLYWDNGQGLQFEREFAVDADFMFTITQRVKNNTGAEVTLYPYGLITQAGVPELAGGVHEGPIGYIGEELHEYTYKKLGKEPLQSFTAAKGWLGITDKYWLAALIPSQAENVKYRFSYQAPSAPGGKARYQTDFTGAPVKIIAGDSAQSTSHLFTGAKRVLLLEQYEKEIGMPHFDLAVHFGKLYFMTKPFFYALHWLGQFTGNFGIAIIILTFAIRTAVFPLTNVSYKSFAKMKKVSPQILEIRNRHGEDKQMLQQELVKMYEREGVNPLAGCFPIVVQIPIFFAFYKTLFVTIEMRHAPFFGWIQDLSSPDPTTIFNLFGLIPYNVPSFLHIGVWPCLMLIAMLIQKRLNPPPQDPIQRDMMNYFPFVITYVLSRFASGLVIYWTVSAVLSILQQMFIMRSLGVPIHLFGETEEEKKLDEAVAHGPSGIHPLAEMAEERADEILHPDDGAPKTVSSPKPKKKKKK